ncbi:hypothetical protein ACW95P_01145 [Candidatus Mycoplasma pogonae]
MKSTINLSEQNREIFVKTTEGKEVQGHILFTVDPQDNKHDEQWVFYVIEDFVYVQKVNDQTGEMKDLTDEEVAEAEIILESYFEEHEVVDETEDATFELEKDNK